MCNCIKELETRLVGDVRHNQVIQSARFIDPRMSICFTGKGGRETVKVELPRCPFCGKKRR